MNIFNENPKSRWTKPSRMAFPLGLGFLCLFLIVSGLQAAQQTADAERSLPAEIMRAQDPVVIAGASFPSFNGFPIADLVLYRHNGVEWQPIPFQVDEVTAGGIYTGTEDGLLDDNDELVFMAGDSGAMAPVDNWPNDGQARAHPRYVITVTDTLAPFDDGWVYLYHSDSLERSVNSYVEWQTVTQTVSALSYTLRYENESFVGIADLQINDSVVDVLDRQKIRGQASVLLFGIPISTTTFNEETILDIITQPLTVSLPIAGPVRAIGGTPVQQLAHYGSRVDLSLSLPLADIEVAPFTVVHFDYIQFSLDLVDPGMSGMAPASYYDSNGTGVPIDGEPDAVPALPPYDWQQVDGSLGGWVLSAQADPANGTVQNTYRDDDLFDPEDTGDGLSFGDAGYRIDDPNGTVSLAQVLYISPPGAGNVGALYHQWASSPLVTTIAEQLYSEIGYDSFLPLLIRQQ